MNSYERVISSLDFQKVDRIARYDSYWSEFDEICKSELKIDPDTPLDDYFGIDISIAYPDETIYPSLQKVITDNGTETIMMDGWGATIKQKAGAFFEETVDTLIKSYEDLDKYPFESPFLDERYIDFEKQVEFDKKRGKCVFGKIGGPYIRSSAIRGAEEYMYDIAADPGFVKELAERLTTHLINIAKEELRRGDLYDTGIWIYDDLAYNRGPIMSPKSFEEIYLPCYKRLVGEIKKAGAKKVCLHSDGNITPLLDMLIDAGIDGINPVEPRAGMSIKELKKRYGNKLAYIGGMCNSDVLVNGPKERIINQTREILELAQDGGVIIGAHSIGPDISVDNYLACYNTLLEYGEMK